MASVFLRLRELNEEVPKPMRLPTEEELSLVEDGLDITFSAGLKSYFLQVSDIVYGCIEPVTITNSDSHTYLPAVAKDAAECGVPKDLVPLCEDNGDFYCVTSEGKVVFWSHDGASQEVWQNIEAWIEDVWMES